MFPYILYCRRDENNIQNHEFILGDGKSICIDRNKKFLQKLIGQASAQGNGEGSQAIKTIIQGDNSTIAVLGGKTFFECSEIFKVENQSGFFFNFLGCNFLKTAMEL